MSSILEALRELEGTKPSAQRSRAAWAAGDTEERSPLRRGAELLGIVAFGLAIGGAGFTAMLWLWPSDDTTATAHAPVPTASAAGKRGATPATPAAPAPAWLGRMGPPRGRVDGAESTSAGPGDASAPRGAGLSLARVRYDDSRAGRSATLRIDGSTIVLQEGESAHGIELQLVTPTGAYVRRGGEVLMLEAR